MWVTVGHLVGLKCRGRVESRRLFGLATEEELQTLEGPLGEILGPLFVFPCLTCGAKSGAVEVVGPSVREIRPFVVVMLD